MSRFVELCVNTVVPHTADSGNYYKLISRRTFCPVIDTTNVSITGHKCLVIDTFTLNITITGHFCLVIDTKVYQLPDKNVR